MNPRASVVIAWAAVSAGCALENPSLRNLPDGSAVDAVAVADRAPDLDRPKTFDAPMDAVAPPCAADDDCRGRADGAVCDVASGRCVRCLPARDTCPAGQYCAATRECLPGCRDDLACAAATSDAGAADAGAGGRCDLAAHECVACLTDDHCPIGALCVGRACVAGCSGTRGCPTGRSCCGGACVDARTDVTHCGACDRRCSVPSATAACREGACAVGACAASTADCNDVAADGCEVELRTSPANCGACGRTGTEVCDGADNDCDGLVDEGFSASGCVSLACTGSGVIRTIGNECLDDFGLSAGSDTLQVYCVAGVARFCLSGEACPWRAGTTTTAAVTCSRAGLASDLMGRASCDRWNSRSVYACDALGRVYFP